MFRQCIKVLHIWVSLWFLVWGGLVCFTCNYNQSYIVHLLITFHFFFDFLCILNATGQEKDQDAVTGGKGGPSGKNGKGKTPPKAQISLLNQQFVTDVCWYHCWKHLPQIASGDLGCISLVSIQCHHSACIVLATTYISRSLHLDPIWKRERERVEKENRA